MIWSSGIVLHRWHFLEILDWCINILYMLRHPTFKTAARPLLRMQGTIVPRHFIDKILREIVKKEVR